MSEIITRKEFVARMAGASVVLLFQACGGGGSDGGTIAAAPAPGPAAAPAPSPTPTASSATCTDTIVANHGHVLTVAAGDLDSMVDLTYDIHGTADHTHFVVLTVAQLSALKAGTTVATQSTITLDHQHDISINCV